MANFSVQKEKENKKQKQSKTENSLNKTEKLDMHRAELGPLFPPYKEVSPNWLKDLNIKDKNTKVLKYSN